MSESNLQFGLLVSNLTVESFDELTDEVRGAGIDLVKVNSSRAILIPVVEDLVKIVESLAFSAENSEDLRIKFVIYCRDDAKYYEDGLAINEQALVEIDADSEELETGFLLDEFSELVVWFLENQELARTDIELIRDKYYPDKKEDKDEKLIEESKLTSEEFLNKFDEEVSEDNISELDDILADVKSDPSTDEENQQHLSRKKRDQVDLNKVDSSSNFPKVEDKLLKKAYELVRKVEGDQFVPKFDDYTKQRLMPALTKYQLKITEAERKMVIEVYNRLLETKNRVETKGLYDHLNKAEAEHNATLEKIDKRQQQTAENIEKTLNAEYDEKKRNYVDSMKPSLEAEYDAKFLEDHQKNIAVHQAKNISLNDDSRKEENDRYEEAIRGMKEKGVEIAVNEVDISDLLEEFDNVVDQELLKLDEEAKKLKLDESDRYKQLLAEKEKILEKAKKSEMQVELISQNLDLMRENYDNEVNSKVASEVAEKTRQLQLENNKLSLELANKQRLIDAEKDKLDIEKKNTEETFKLEQDKAKSLIEQLEAAKRELADEKQKNFILQSQSFQNIQNPSQISTRAEKVSNSDNNKKSSWAKNLLYVSASIVLLGIGGIGGYRIINSINSTSNKVESVSITSSKKESSTVNTESTSSDKQQASEKTSSISSSTPADTSLAESSSSVSTVLSIPNTGAKIGDKFYYTLPNGDSVEILKTSQNSGQYTDGDGKVQKVYIAD